MGNMSYCRNENTFSDLRDVRMNARRPTNDTEKAYLKKIINECADLLEGFYVPIDESAIAEALKMVDNLRTIDDEELGDD